ETDDTAAEHAHMLTDAIPFSIIGSTEDARSPYGRLVKGHEYLWGIAEVENENYSDFHNLRSLLICRHMFDLNSMMKELHYENYRQQQMETRKFWEPCPSLIINGSWDRDGT
ncbi:Septin-type guanine nucleotide-binding (G) domain-containing protein, partial [Suillus spraguei]